MENLLFLGVPILKHIRVVFKFCITFVVRSDQIFIAHLITVIKVIVVIVNHSCFAVMKHILQSAFQHHVFIKRIYGNKSCHQTS